MSWRARTRREGGRLAGPVVAAASYWIISNPPLEANDSKKLSSLKREALFEKIMSEARYVGIGECSEKEIDEINILRASMLAMRRAVENSKAPVTMLLADGNVLRALWPPKMSGPWWAEIRLACASRPLQ